MRITIANDEVAFVSDSHGAEMHSLRFVDEEVDYLWMPPEPGPARTSLCFPLLGTVPDGRYELAGRTYEIPMHGFARDMDLGVVARTDISVTYAMRDSAQTMLVYPFPFRLRVRYALDGPSLLAEYTVDNPGDEEMLYSVGSHPRFTCPVDPTEGARFNDHHIAFDAPEKPERLVRAFGSRDAIDLAFTSDRRRLRLDQRLFPDGAFCFGSLDSDRVVLASDRSRRGLELELPKVSYLQVWSVPGSPFVAMEPWYGSISGNPAREEDRFWDRRPGTLTLAPGSNAKHAFRMTPIR